LEEVLQQLTRWYDAEVRYEGQVPEMQFGGRISRNNNLSEVLKILELSNVHFRIEGKTIVVMP
jgi:transmembrane sensor